MAEPGPTDLVTQRPDTGAPTVTHGFLFADLRGYTRYTDAHGDHAAADLLERYRTLVRGAVSNFHGAEIKTEGDSFYVVFDSASAAVRCGLEIVKAASATADGPADAIQVGVGVHAGETVETAEGYVGSAVNIAARLCAQAKAGELVVSETVRALTRTYLDVEFEPLGTRRLKGLDEPIGIDRVVPRGAPRPRGLRSRWVGARRGRRLAAFGAVALVVVLAGAGVAAWQGTRPSPMATPSPTASALVSATSAAPSVQPSPTAAANGLTSDEQALLARIPSDFRPYCRRSSLTEGSLGGDTNVRCDLTSLLDTSSIFGADTVWYDEFGTLGSVDAAVNGLVGREQLPDGVCGPGDGQAAGRWSLGVTYTGRMACYAKGGAAWILWSYDQGQIVARAVRHDGDAKRLYAWWYEVRGLLGYG